MVDKSKKYSKIVNKMPLAGINNASSHERKKSIEYITYKRQMEQSLKFSEAGNNVLTKLIE